MEYEILEVRENRYMYDTASVKVRTRDGMVLEVVIHLDTEDIKMELDKAVDKWVKVLRNLKALQEMAKSAEDTE